MTAFCSLCSVSCSPVSGFVVNVCWPEVFLVQGNPLDHPECFHVYIQFIEGAASQSVVFRPLFVVFAQCLVVQVSGLNVCWPEVFLVRGPYGPSPSVFMSAYNFIEGAASQSVVL